MFDVARAGSLGKTTRSSWGCNRCPVTQVILTVGAGVAVVCLAEFGLDKTVLARSGCTSEPPAIAAGKHSCLGSTPAS